MRAPTSLASPPVPAPPPPREPTMPSISSRRRMAGAARRALANAARNVLSPSPTYLEKTSAAARVTTVAPEAVAAARAIVVLAHPVCIVVQVAFAKHIRNHF